MSDDPRPGVRPRRLAGRRGFFVGLVVLAVMAGPAVSPAATEPDPVSPSADGHVWLDVDGIPLPFQSDAEVIGFLKEARVEDRDPTDRGVAGAERIVLTLNGLRVHAAFRSVDEMLDKAPSGIDYRGPYSFRDAAVYEGAAYELSEALGMHRVPPTVQRWIGIHRGTVQIWVEDAIPEVARAERNLQPPDSLRWVRQKQIMYVFDNLIANADRNKGNYLIDEQWNLWFIDHTRAFARISLLFYEEKLNSCERGLWLALLNLDKESLTESLDPYLSRQEISSLFKRRKMIINHIENLIEERGEAAVLFDLPPSSQATSSF